MLALGLLGGVLVIGLVIALAGSPSPPEPVASPSAVGAPAPSVTTVTPSPTRTATPTPLGAATEAPPGEFERALLTLASIPVVDGRSEQRYYRDEFGEPWFDVDGNGCRTRDDILGRDLDDVVFRPGTNNCRVASGVLTDPYSGVVRQFVSGSETSQLVPVDHIVALAWAWRHGAEDWSFERRVEFANDPRNLTATTKEMNDEKLAHGPAEWLPPVEALRCDYLVRWVDVLDTYDIGINPVDRDAAARVLEAC